MSRKKTKNILSHLHLIKTPAGVLATLLTLFFSALAAWPTISNIYEQNYRSKENTLTAIYELSPGTNISFFKERFNEPVFVNTINEGLGLKEYVFVNKFIYLDVITNKDDKSLQYTISVRDVKFNPEFDLPNSKFKAKLGKTKFSEIVETPNFIQGCSGAHNWSYYEIYYLANPGNYQTVAFGVNDAVESNFSYEILDELNELICPKVFEPYQLIDVLDPKYYEIPSSYINNERLQKFKSGATINSYTITGPLEPLVTGAIGVGVNINEVRILKK